jgi:hypothetical protein
MARFTSGLLLLCSAASLSAAQDSAVVRGDVISALGGTPLAYSTFSINAGAGRFSNADGSFSFRAVRGASYHLRIRHLGYQPLDTVITAAGSEGLRLHIPLRGIAYRLAAVRTETRHPCAADIRRSELSAILEQVSENAERERVLRGSYPFQYRIERTRRSEWSGSVSRYVRDTVVFLSNALDPYTPGRTVRPAYSGEGMIREMRIPQLTDLASEDFVRLHCFSYGGIQRVDGRKDYEIDFEPIAEAEFPDVRGTIFIDTATYLIDRAEFEVTRPDALDPPVATFRVTTFYRDLGPGLRLFDSAQSVQSFPRVRPTDAIQRETESQRLLGVHFLGDSLPSPHPRR